MTPLQILVAGPYRSGTGDDPAKIKANVDAMTEMALRLFRAGHLPVLGEWYALPLIEFAGSAKTGIPSRVATGFSSGKAPVFSKASVNSRVLTFETSTSGWSNGLMPMIAPATAVAISQRKNSWPICIASETTMRTTGCPAASSAATALSCS